MKHDPYADRKITAKLKRQVVETLRKRFPAASFTVKSECSYTRTPVARQMQVMWRDAEPLIGAVKAGLAFFDGRSGLVLALAHREPCSRCRHSFLARSEYLEADGLARCWECERKAKAAKAEAAQAVL
jgi:hypothetical protein